MTPVTGRYITAVNTPKGGICHQGAIVEDDGKGQSGDTRVILKQHMRGWLMRSNGCETRFHRTAGWMAEWLAAGFVSAMAIISTLRLLGILS